MENDNFDRDEFKVLTLGDCESGKDKVIECLKEMNLHQEFPRIKVYDFDVSFNNEFEEMKLKIEVK